MNIVNLHMCKLNLCYVAYTYNGRRERERERRKERSLQDHVIHNKMRIASCVYPTIFPCVDPRPQLSRFFTGISRRRYVVLLLMFIMGNIFPHRESTSWNFPAKIRNSLRPIFSFDMMSKFPGSDHSCRRRYVIKLFVGKNNNNKKKKKKNKEISRSGLFLSGRISPKR